jgi:RNA polymerase sigma factor (sigma-70 family)
MSTMPATSAKLDLQCLLLAKAGELQRLVEQKIPARFKSRITAEDVLQEVWISAFRSYDDFRPDGPGAFERWLMAIINRRMADAIRSAGARKRGGDRCVFHGGTSAPRSWADLFAKLSANGRTPSGELSAQEASQAIQIALSSLSEGRRQAVCLRLLEGRSREEVAQAMQRRGVEVTRLVRLGLRDLRRRLRHAGRFFSDTKSSADYGLATDASPEKSSDM